VIFYNGFNLLVDVVAVMATAFITYRIAFRAGLWQGMELHNDITLDEHWKGVVHE
jgi:hypothetical protein